ncbi:MULTISPECIES: phosphohistidine phosphatase SixA [unclassified Pseudoalteromonas]|jgi:phosphohistidine phosphatase|uniref:phosphohistidine phosphatase SixA n=1 Tax=unclassified Pseudoalteromonas TaxID=194690 RepID=UPI0005AA8470|nr:MULTISPECIES: phosphohistidine phosphatase SixA [unclassified Pseudoalteromonas]
MKKIFIMRHGQASPMCADDASRTLTNSGIREVEAMNKWLEKTASVDAVLVSPYVRAQQTYQLLKQGQNNIKLEQTSSDFIPEASPAYTCDFLQALISLNPDNQNWLVVAHMPLVSYLVGELCPGKMPIFDTAAIACIEYNEDKGQGELVGLKSPNRL